MGVSRYVPREEDLLHETHLDAAVLAGTEGREWFLLVRFSSLSLFVRRLRLESEMDVMREK